MSSLGLSTSSAMTNWVERQSIVRRAPSKLGHLKLQSMTPPKSVILAAFGLCAAHAVYPGGCSYWQFQTQPTGVNAQQGPIPYPPTPPVPTPPGTAMPTGVTPFGAA